MSKPNTPAAAKDTPPQAATGPESAWVRAKNGNMLHLFTNVWFTSDPKKVELDDFVRVQIAAEKLEVVQP